MEEPDLPESDGVLIPYLSTRPLRVIARHEGGFGRVLIVEALDGGRYALKSIKRGGDPSTLADEASRLVDVAPHENVINVIGVVWHGGQPHIVLPAMSGNLRDLLERRTLSVDRVVMSLRQIASGLAHLHERAEILHLDLKPENVLVASDGHCVITDFGLSVSIPEPDGPDLPNVLRSSVIGTFAYMSPEQFTRKRLNAKADVFAFGVLAFELLTGRHPFQAPTVRDVVLRILVDVPSFTVRERLRLPARLRLLCMACLEKNETRRPSAVEVVRLLDEGGALYPVRPMIVNDLADQVNRANTLVALSKVDEAVRLLDECLEENPLFLPAVTSRAEIEFARGDPAKAAELAETAVASSAWISPPPNGLTTLLTNLSLYVMPTNPLRSIAFSRAAVRIDSHDWQALGNLAEACRVIGDAKRDQTFIDEGLSAVRRALALAPDDVKLLITYGGLLLANGQLEVVGPLVIRLVNQHGGDNVFLRLLLIRTFIATGQLQEAEKWLAPMRQHKELQPIVTQAEQEMRARQGASHPSSPPGSNRNGKMPALTRDEIIDTIRSMAPERILPLTDALEAGSYRELAKVLRTASTEGTSADAFAHWANLVKYYGLTRAEEQAGRQNRGMALTILF